VEDACHRLRDEPGLVDLPDRLSLFGPTRLTTEQVLVLDALAAHRDVHLWLTHPSHGLWDRVAGTDAELTTRRDDPTADLARHPLLGSCGRDAREMQVRLLGSRQARPPGGQARTAADAHLAADGTGATTLLGTLQRDIREDRAPAGHLALGPDDRSVQVHACHGRQRQVEVLREVLLGLLADDPTLEPRDIIVMCPDIETYAPLISATFGLVAEDAETLDPRADDIHPGHRLRVRLADRSLRQTNPVLTVVGRLLELADARLTASEVLDLAAMPAVRARFGFDDDELERVGDWVRRSGVRWGLDATARAPYHLDGVRQNTWQAGLDRLLVGVTMDEDELRTVGMALPLDDVDSNEADLAGRFAELVDRLAGTVAQLQGPQPLTGWVEALLAAVDALTWAPPYDAWQAGETRRELVDALAAAAGRADAVSLGLQDVRALLAQRLRGRPTRANFRTGQLTMCTMVPMRSVPHRVVCLLGVDDGVFPRATHADGDDVLARTPRVGERDPRSEDRQLFLDAIMAAREKLVVLYTGADERTGAPRPPAVPLGELLDVLDRTLRQAQDTAGGVRDRVLVRHPLQPFDARNFVAGDLGEPGAFSFDRASFAGASALLGERHPKPPFLAAPLDDDGVGDTVELEALATFLEHPTKSFLRRRLGISTLAEEEEPADALPVELDGLQEWGIGERLLHALLKDADPAQAQRAEWLRGDLPPGPLGTTVLGKVMNRSGALAEQARGLRPGDPATCDVAVTLEDGTRLLGTVTDLFGDRVVRVTYSKLAAKHRVRAWVSLLALAAGAPGSWSAATLGRGRKDDLLLAQLTGPDPEHARRVLGDLVKVYRAGQRQPLPLSPKTSCAYAERRAGNGSIPASVSKAGFEWRYNYSGRDIGEYDDAEHQLVWGDAQLSDLCIAMPWPELPFADEGRLFGQLARLVFDPMFAAEGLRQL
jgi:exodeoxyribonuclease V gamma subunit